MSEATAPLLQVRGRLDDVELAALVAVLLATAARRVVPPAAAPEPLWGAPATLVRGAGRVVPGGWGGPSATLRG